MLRRESAYDAVEETDKTINVTELAKIIVFSIASQTLALPSIFSHKKRQCSKVKRLGIISPGRVSVTVSTNRKMYMNMIGIVTSVSPVTMGQFLKLCDIADSYCSILGGLTSSLKRKNRR